MSNSSMTQYKQIFKKQTNFLYECRPFGPSHWLIDDFIGVSDRHKDMSSINSKTSLFNLLAENESKWMFTSEALVKTYPFKNAFVKFKKEYDDKVDPQLSALMKSDFFYGQHADCLLRDVADISGEDKSTGVVAQFIVYFPFFDHAQANEFVKQMTDDMHFYGYYLSRTGVDEYAEEKEVNGQQVKLQYMTFEAKFAHVQFEMTDFLYHVAPIEVMKKISTHGLVPRSGNNSFSYPDSVYLFNNVDMSIIINYGISKSDRRPSRKFALMKLSSEKLKALDSFKNGKLEFFIDRKMPPIEDQQPCAIFTYGNIPTKVIESEVQVFTFDENDIIVKKELRQLSSFKS